MIVRIKLPERVGYMALHLDEGGAWVPITGRVSDSPALAQQLCISDVRDLLADVIDSLTARLRAASVNVARILDQPQDGDRVSIGGFERPLDSDGAVIIDEWQLDEAVLRGLDQLGAGISDIDDLTWKTLEKILDSDSAEIEASFRRFLEYIKHNPMPLLDHCEATQPERLYELTVLMVQLFRELRVEGSAAAADSADDAEDAGKPAAPTSPLSSIPTSAPSNDNGEPS